MIRRQGFYVCTKTFGEVRCSFRRWKSTHYFDKILRPYELTVKVVLEAHHLGDDRRVMLNQHDCMLEFRKLLDRTWTDHVVVANDDPELLIFKAMETKGIIQLTTLPDVGTEPFAAEMYSWLKVWLTNSELIKQVDVRAVEIVETRYSSSLYTE